ncbi:hypothetical protein [Thalassotalea ganghwensis]
MMTLFSWYVSNNGNKLVNNPVNEVDANQGMWPTAKVRLHKAPLAKEVQGKKHTAENLPLILLANKRRLT